MLYEPSCLTTFHVAVLLQFYHFLVDLILLPFTLLLTFSFYRAKYLHYTLNLPKDHSKYEIWHRETLQDEAICITLFQCQVLICTYYAFLDILLLPFTIIVFLTVISFFFHSIVFTIFKFYRSKDARRVCDPWNCDIANVGAFGNGLSHFQLEIVKAAWYLFIDLLLLPFTILLFISVPRIYFSLMCLISNLSATSPSRWWLRFVEKTRLMNPCQKLKTIK